MLIFYSKCFFFVFFTKNGIGDANDVWKVFIVGGKENETVKTVTSRFILVHYLQNCILTATGKQLPKWGFEQQEVTCNLNLRDKNGYWNVEDNRHKKRKYFFQLFLLVIAY